MRGEQSRRLGNPELTVTTKSPSSGQLLLIHNKTLPGSCLLTQTLPIPWTSRDREPRCHQRQGPHWYGTPWYSAAQVRCRLQHCLHSATAEWNTLSKLDVHRTSLVTAQCHYTNQQTEFGPFKRAEHRDSCLSFMTYKYTRCGHHARCFGFCSSACLRSR